MTKLTVKTWIEKQAQYGKIAFALDDLKRAFPTAEPTALKSGLYRACRRKEVAIAWQGFYLILPLEYRGVGNMPPSEYIDKLMCYLGKPYCVALLNAAAIYGAAHQRPMNYVIMTSNPPPRCKVQGNVKIDFIAKRTFTQGIPSELVKRVKTQYSSINVTTPEFTALSLVQYAHAAGGLSHVLTVLEELVESCRFDQLPAVIWQHIPLACFQRLGYMLERLLREQNAADKLYAAVQDSGRQTQKIKLAPGSSAYKGGYDDKWKVYINIQLESDLDD